VAQRAKGGPHGIEVDVVREDRPLACSLAVVSGSRSGIDQKIEKRGHTSLSALSATPCEGAGLGRLTQEAALSHCPYSYGTPANSGRSTGLPPFEARPDCPLRAPSASRTPESVEDWLARETLADRREARACGRAHPRSRNL